MTLLKIDLLKENIPNTFTFVDSVMGKNPEKRLRFIQDKVKANEPILTIYHYQSQVSQVASQVIRFQKEIMVIINSCQKGGHKYE